MNLYIGLKFSLVICLKFRLPKYIHRLSMTRSQKRSLRKQNENFDNLKLENGPKAGLKAVFTHKISAKT